MWYDYANDVWNVNINVVANILSKEVTNDALGFSHVASQASSDGILALWISISRNSSLWFRHIITTFSSMVISYIYQKKIEICKFWYIKFGKL